MRVQVVDGAGNVRTVEPSGPCERLTPCGAPSSCALVLALLAAAPAVAAPGLAPFASVGRAATFAGSPTGDSHRVFVVEQAGRVRLVLDGMLQPTPFLDLTHLGARAAASAGCCRSRSRATTR